MEPESVPKNTPKNDSVVHASGNLGAKAKESRIAKNVDGYAKAAKEYNLAKYYQKGFYLDTKDEFNWCVAQIQNINDEKKSLHIHFDNWSSKYDEELKRTSDRIFPLRFHSVKYTGQKKSTIREFDSEFINRDKIVERMAGYADTQFLCTSEDEIQEMYQFLCGECYLYLDSLLTCDDKGDANKWELIIQTIVEFFKMLTKWLNILPQYIDYITHMKKHPYLYLVCPEAAIVNLYKSFITTVELIFGLSPRSSDFMSTASAFVEKNNLATPSKFKRIYTVQVYFMQ